MSARVLQINVSPGGVPKRAVASAFVGRGGLEGDAVNHPKIHGGPERAVCLFSLDLVQALQAEGHPVFPGSTGENLTVAGLDWSALAPDAVLAVGGAVRLQLTTRVEPCRTIADSFADGGFKRIQPKRVPDETRWYARVLAEGTVRPGDEIRVES
ncbi:MOSC domain-containing protein [Rubrivirga litoralis]|uniref:MOSC domain-containing protein n=2 Tax=Rubrivirga TaxID=1434037 RepID=A0ABU3BVB5_9BACT|nr:MOSC domain-containing protein [Rubrivirga sp. F394]MDT0633096.1 MOSC domain-containing protein [Rubrivirga sp. F394]